MRPATRLSFFVCCSILLSLALISATKHRTAYAQLSPSDLEKKLLQAVQNDDAAAARRLLEQGANIEARGWNGCTPLLLAAENSRGSIAKMLLERGANASAKDEQGDTVLMLAARAGNVDLVQELLRRGASQDERTRALFEALHGGPVGIVLVQGKDTAPAELPADPWHLTARLLLDTGLDLEARDEEGNTPLMAAANYAQTEVVQMLLRRGADVKARDNRGFTALMGAACECALATMNSGYDSVKLLLDAGSDVNARANDGSTALILAAGGFGDVATLKLLVERGANPNLRNKKGETALAIAKPRSDSKAQYLRSVSTTH